MRKGWGENGKGPVQYVLLLTSYLLPSYLVLDLYWCNILVSTVGTSSRYEHCPSAQSVSL